jgi:homogentisate 1,2-dioxygenase
MIYQIDFDTEENRLFLREIFCPFLYPKDIKRIRTTFRAFSICERDFILPNELETHDEKGDF